MRVWSLHEALTYGSGDERPFLCPVHGDSRPSASVNIIKKKWFCYTCGARGGLTGEDALLEPDYDVMREWFAKKTEEKRVYPESWLARYTAGSVHSYWANRVGEAAARHFQLGWDVESDRLTYPLRDPGGGVLGVVRRRGPDVDPGRGGRGAPKYLYPAGVDVGSLLFNYDQQQHDVLVLVEGALDAIALWRVGVHAVAIYGARLSDEQVRLIARCDPHTVVTAYDNDDAGWQAHSETRRALRGVRVQRLSWPKSWGKDVDEIGQNKLKKSINKLAVPGLWCVGSEPCRPRIVSSSSRSTSTRSRPQILRTAS